MKRIDWPKWMIVGGLIALVVGGVDPMEGSAAILPGSALVALGTFLAGRDRKHILFRLRMFLMIAFGIGALAYMTFIGGIGGETGRSMWWGVFVLPYLIGWSMSVWGPGSPRWAVIAGLVVGVWYLALFAIIMVGARSAPKDIPYAPIIVVATVGLMTVVGCVYSLRKRPTIAT